MDIKSIDLKKHLKSAYRLAIYPIVKFPVFFLLIGILLFLPEFMAVDGLRPKLIYLYQHLLTTVTFSFSLSYFLCAIFSLISRLNDKAGVIVAYVVEAIVLIYSASSVYLYQEFGIQYIQTSLELLLQTNSSEASEFVKTYLASKTFLSIIGLYLLLYLATFLLNRCKRPILKALSFIQHYALVVLLMLCVVLSIHKLSTFFYRPIGEQTVGCPIFDVFDNQVFKDAVALQTMIKGNVKINPEKMLYDTCIDSVSHLSDNIVLIIGETYNRHHSSQYGYPLNTNPFTSELNPYIFTNVVSPCNSTHIVLKYLLTLWCTDDSIDYHELPMLLPIVKAAGYNVTLFSNQFIKDSSKDGWEMALNMIFDNPLVEEASYNHRNTEVFKYDGELVDDFISKRDSIEGDSLNFTILHLMGQHCGYGERLPATETQFTVDDYDFRPELNDELKQLVADYDNATLYNDKVVARIVDLYKDKEVIIIYMPDHGEEVCDSRAHAGRYHNIKDSSVGVVHSQFDIPFMVFVTDKYREAHPEVIERIEASLDKPFMTDALPYLLLYLAGIDTQWYRPERNILDEDFDPSRPRILYLDNYDYDAHCRPTDKVIGF